MKVKIKKDEEITVGGQAVIEGVMMRRENQYAVAIRKPNQEIIIEEMKRTSWKEKNKILSFPFIRGMVAFLESMIMGMKILTFSAEFFEEEEVQNESKFDQWVNRVFKDKANDVFIGISVVMALIMTILLFIVLPLGITEFIKPFLPSEYWVNFVDGVLRVAILVVYILLISRMKDIQRVFQYHGAEHKSIHCYECGLDLTIDNAKKQPRLHKRCGTSFLLYVVVISVFIMTLINAQTFFYRFVVRILMLPIIAGISYEVLKLIGRSESKALGFLAKPGLMLQKLTTKEPDEQQIEVALEALKCVLKEEKMPEDKIEDYSSENIPNT